jgi:hypothetical protein
MRDILVRGEAHSEIAPVLRSSESLGYIVKAENTDHAKVHMIST